MNSYNASERKRNSSGIKGVTWYEKSSKWRAQIRYAGKNYHLGLYDSLEDAKGVRIKAESFVKTNFDDPDKIIEYLKGVAKR